MRLVLIAVALLTIIGAVFLLFFSDAEDPGNVPAVAGNAAPPGDNVAPSADARTASATPPASTDQVQEAAERPTALVDSYPAEAQGDVSAWRRLDANAGYLDVAVVQESGRRLGEDDSVPARERVVVSGWAGDTGLGMRLRDVVLTMCGKVVARGQVNGARPDVARAVHRNLTWSGWRISVLAADLPDCPSSILQAHAVVPGQTPALVALNGSLGLTVTARGRDVPDRASQQPDIAPATYERPKALSVEITGSRVNLRRCGDTACEAVGQIDAGTYEAFVVDRDGDWSLLLFGEKAGWIYNRLFEVRR